MDTDLIANLALLSSYSAGLGILALLWFRRISTTQRKIFSLVVLNLTTELLVQEVMIYHVWTPLFGQRTNLPLLHVFTLLQFILICWIFRDFLREYFSAGVIYGLVGAFALFVVVNAVWIDGIFQLNPHARAIESLLLLFLFVSYYSWLLRYMRIKRLEYDPLFWISAGFLIYFSGNFLIFLFSNYLLLTNEVLFSIYGVHSILNVVANLAIVISLWVVPRMD